MRKVKRKQFTIQLSPGNLKNLGRTHLFITIPWNLRVITLFRLLFGGIKGVNE